MPSRVLWIEDGVTDNMSRLFAAAVANGAYDLTPATNATEGAAYLESEPFDAVVVDIRLPPGNGEQWVQLFSERRRSTAAARLGLWLVYAALRPTDQEVGLKAISLVNKNARFGFLTVEPENDLRRHLDRLKPCSYARKVPNDPKTLVRLIETLLH